MTDSPVLAQTGLIARLLEHSPKVGPHCCSKSLGRYGQYSCQGLHGSSHIDGFRRLAIDLGERAIGLREYPVDREGANQGCSLFAIKHRGIDREVAAHVKCTTCFGFCSGKPM